MPTVTQTHSRITLSSDGLERESKGATGKASDSILTVLPVPESETKAGENAGTREKERSSSTRTRLDCVFVQTEKRDG